MRLPTTPRGSCEADSNVERIDQITYEDVSTIVGLPLAEIKVQDRCRALRGAQILAQCLKLEGVDVLFGYPGGANLEIFDVLEDSGIRCIRVEHEQGAAHAAEGFARATGKVGVCLATSGPGATNLVTGIADANSDSVPIVAITGNVPSHLLGKNAFQEVKYRRHHWANYEEKFFGRPGRKHSNGREAGLRIGGCESARSSAHRYPQGRTAALSSGCGGQLCSAADAC